jgi:hypothetical protein
MDNENNIMDQVKKSIQARINDGEVNMDEYINKNNFIEIDKNNIPSNFVKRRCCFITVDGFYRSGGFLTSDHPEYIRLRTFGGNPFVFSFQKDKIQNLFFKKIKEPRPKKVKKIKNGQRESNDSREKV